MVEKLWSLPNSVLVPFNKSLLKVLACVSRGLEIHLLFLFFTSLAKSIVIKVFI